MECHRPENVSIAIGNPESSLVQTKYMGRFSNDVPLVKADILAVNDPYMASNTSYARRVVS
jgi:hypothetical protein